MTINSESEEKDSLPERLFVYGSLKRGFVLHHHLRDAEFLGHARTEPRYRLFDCGEYPAMTEHRVGGCSVSGEVYRVTVEILSVLDVVEGVSEDLYVRRPIALQPPFAREMVWGYLYMQSVRHLPDLGDFWPRTIGKAADESPFSP
ncbi:MAG: gamma-glutamylcyclotransferase [Planctomycetaceae bacterium]|nr:gamma-glutamylcyclotransferase [Planctomycetaceae bacterium]